jgi:hypothetical protein
MKFLPGGEMQSCSLSVGAKEISPSAPCSIFHQREESPAAAVVVATGGNLCLAQQSKLMSAE